MPKRLTVFYSWQSDTPSSVNRNFIEKALREALTRLHSDATLEDALRDTTVELDKDTKNVAGSPPIADTILAKVAECAVFVADLTFVGQPKEQLVDSTSKRRQFPNPNVLIEYGYALRCHSHSRLVSIMNTAYGESDAESLPFDLRHLRWPITYQLADSSAADKGDQFEKLVATLVAAIGLILSKHSAPSAAVEKFVPRKHTKNAAAFYDNVAELVPDSHLGREVSWTVPDGGKAYLRLYPTVAVPPIDSEMEARDLAVSGYLHPMGKVGGYGAERNSLGAIVYESPRGNNTLYCFTQLLLSREIWGIDARVLNPDYQRALSESIGMQTTRNHIPSVYIEEQFVLALQNYLKCAASHLLIPTPVRFEAGLVGIKNYAIATPANAIVGNALRDEVIWRGDVNYETPAWEMLEPFFKKMWANCDIVRSPERQGSLVFQFRNSQANPRS